MFSHPEFDGNETNEPYVKFYQQKWWEKILNYMSESSLFILHKDNIFRQYLLCMTSSPDIVAVKKAVIEQPEQYGIEDISLSVRFNHIEFINGIILASKNLRLLSQIFEGIIIA